MLLNINREGILKICCAILFSCFFSFVIFPFIIKLGISKKVLELNDDKFFIGVTALTICILLFYWNSTNKFWNKYKQTYKIERSNILSVDIFAIFVIISFLFILIFCKNEVANIPNKFMSYLFFNLLFIVSWSVSSFYWPKKDSKAKYAISKGGMLLSDSPIEFEEQDLLNRGLFIDDFFKEVMGVPFTDSFVYGLFGKWGEGKTSVLNLFTNKAKKEKNLLIVNFDPWHFHDTKSIFAAFYEQIENVLSNKYIFSDIKNTFKKYQNYLSTGVSQSGIPINLNAEDESLNDVRDRIESYIRQTRNKLIIIIDDIDRLEPIDIINVFKLVRLNSNFKKTIFILSFDYEMVVNKLNESNFGYGGEYIEKIIQKPVILPKLEQETVDRYFFGSDHEIPNYDLNELKFQKGYISTWGFIHRKNNNLITISPYQEIVEKSEFYNVKFPEERSFLLKQLNEGDKIFIKGMLEQKKYISIDSENAQIIKYRLSLVDDLFHKLAIHKKITHDDIKMFDQEVGILYRTDLSKLISTFREIKRFMNSFSTSIYPIAEEIDLKDIFLLEFIKVFKPELYNHIYDHWWLYVDKRVETDQIFGPFSISFTGKQEEKKEIRKKHVEMYLNKICKDEFKKELFNGILNELFSSIRDEFSGASSESDPNKKIDSTNFLKYFLMKVPSFELSHSYMESIIQKWNDNRLTDEQEIKKLIHKLQETGQLIEFLDKLKNVYIKKIEPNVAGLLIKFIYKQIDMFSLKGTENLWNSEYDKAHNLLLRIINDRTGVNSIQEILEDVILNTPNLRFACSVVLSCRKDRGGELYKIYGSIDMQSLTKSVSMRLKEYFVDQKRDILKEFPENRDWVFILYQWGTDWGLETEWNRELVGGYLISIIKKDKKNFVKLVSYYINSDTTILDSKKIVDINIVIEIAEKLKMDEELDNNEREIIEQFISKAKSAK